MENPGIKYGLVTGFFVVAGSLLSYFTNPKLYLSPVMQGGFVVVFIVFMHRAGTEERDAKGGFISWREVIKPIFMAGALAAFIVAIFKYVLFNFMNPDLLEVQKEMTLEALERMSGFIGEETVNLLEEEEFSFGVGEMITDFFLNCILGLIPSAMLAAIVKRNKPNGYSV